MLKEFKRLKHVLKRKVKVTHNLIIAFLILGTVPSLGTEVDYVGNNLGTTTTIDNGTPSNGVYITDGTETIDADGNPVRVYDDNQIIIKDDINGVVAGDTNYSDSTTSISSSDASFGSNYILIEDTSTVTGRVFGSIINDTSSTGNPSKNWKVDRDWETTMDGEVIRKTDDRLFSNVIISNGDITSSTVDIVGESSFFLNGGITNIDNGGDNYIEVNSDSTSSFRVAGTEAQGGTIKQAGDNYIVINTPNATDSQSFGNSNLFVYGSNSSILEVGGNDTIIINSPFAGQIFGERATSLFAPSLVTGGNDIIIVHDANYDGIFGESGGSLGKGGDDHIEVYGVSARNQNFYGSIFGDYGILEVIDGGDDYIYVDENSTLTRVYGDYSTQALIQGGSDTIIFDGTADNILSNTFFDIISGDWGLTIESGGDDNITINGNIIDVVGDFAVNSIGQSSSGGGGNNTITISSTGVVNGYVAGNATGASGTITNNSATYGNNTITIDGQATGGVYGQYAPSGTITNTDGGNDTIIIGSAAVVGDVYGEYAPSGTITNNGGGNDTFKIIGDPTFNLINGGTDSTGTITGDYDTLQLSSYTGNFLGFMYEGIEEVVLMDNTNIDLGSGPYSTIPGENFVIESGSSIIGDSGDYIIDSDLDSSGTINLIGDSGNIVGDTLTVKGDFSGTLGSIKLDMDESSATTTISGLSDMIHVEGDFSGTQIIEPQMTNPASTFDPRFIDFMKVDGANTGAVGFASLSRSSGVITKGRISGSAFEWDVQSRTEATGGDTWFVTAVQGVDVTLPPAPERPGVVDPTDPSTPDGGGSTGGGDIVVLPELPAYASLQNIGEDMIHSNVDSLYTRLGDIRRYKAENEGESLTKDKVIQDDDYMELSRDGVTVWTRATAEYFDYEANGDAYGYDGDVSGFDIGADYTFELSRDTAVVAGLLYGKRYGNFETSTSDEGKYVVAESADIDMDSWSLAAYGTFIYKDNTYLDLVAGYTDYESDIDAPGLNDSVDGDAMWGSAEVGHSFQVGDIWRVEPQLQLTYTEVDFDDTTNDVGTEVEYSSNNQLTGRIGTIVSAGIPINEVAQVRPWFGVSVLQEFMDPEDVTYGGTDFEGQDIDTYIEYKLGVQLDLNEAVGMYVEGKYQTDYDDYDSYRGTLGVKYSF